MNEIEMREWIDNASYESLLHKWRYGLAGDPFFKGDIGKYYSKKMAEMKEKVGHDAAVSASKLIG